MKLRCRKCGNASLFEGECLERAIWGLDGAGTPCYQAKSLDLRVIKSRMACSACGAKVRPSKEDDDEAERTDVYFDGQVTMEMARKARK